MDELKLNSDPPKAAPVHVPVMVDEVMEHLCLRAGAVAVDGTLGLAGHALRMAEIVGPDGVLVGLDWDQTMLSEAWRRLAWGPTGTNVENPGISPENADSRSFRVAAGKGMGNSGPRVELRHADFRQIGAILDDLKLRADGVLLDLGLNSGQVDDPERGMAFKHDGPLDLRMDRSRGEPASALLNRMSPDQIEQLLHDYADERWARAIARKIVERRKQNPLRTTKDLVEAVLAAIPVGARDKRIHPATRSFQAVRIAVNGELDGLDQALRDAAATLAPNGTLVVLSYHSGEDRIVKSTFRELAREYDNEDRFGEVLKRPQTPSPEEISRNPRSRSAKLRVLRRISPTLDLSNVEPHGSGVEPSTGPWTAPPLN